MNKPICIIIDFDDTLVESNTARDVLREYVSKEYDEIADLYKTKKVNFIAKPSLISWAKRFTKLPVVIIGGITNKNFRKLLLHKPDFLAISGGIWDKKPAKAIREFL